MGKLYRVLGRLNRGKNKIIESGSLTRLQWLEEKDVETLIAVGAVAEVASPPLTALPGWKLRANKLFPLQITDAIQFLDSDSGELAVKLETDQRAIDRWKAEVRQWLLTPQKRKSGG